MLNRRHTAAMGVSLLLLLPSCSSNGPKRETDARSPSQDSSLSSAEPRGFGEPGASPTGGDQGKNGQATAGRDGQSPRTARWNSSYLGSGSAFFRDIAGFQTDYPAPRVFTASLTRDKVSPNDIYGVGGRLSRDSKEGGWHLGLRLQPQNKEIVHVSLTFPRPPDRQLSYNFPLRSPLPWLQMAPGADQVVATMDGQFSVILHRTNSHAWRFDFQLEAGRNPPTPADAEFGFLFITGNEGGPPWTNFDIRAEIKTQDSLNSESFRLNFCAPLSEPCPDPSG